MFKVSLILIVALFLGAKTSQVTPKSGQELKTLLTAILPPSLAPAFDRTLSEEEILKTMGAPNLRDKDKIFYQIEKYKYKVILGISDSKLSYINYKNLNRQLTLTSFKSLIAKDEVKFDATADAHQRGRLLVVEKHNPRIMLWFTNDSKKTLDRIEVWIE